MTKLKVIGLIGGITIVVAIGAGFWFWRNHNKSKSPRLVQTVSNNGQTLSETSDPNSIPLTQTRPRPSSYNGLSLAPDSSQNNLGQLTPNSDSSNNSSSSRSAVPKELDPKTFGEYEQYKNGESALFGDMQVGSGAELAAGMKAAVYYKGWLTNGQLFDMSRPDKDGKLEPFVFEMGARQVIPGWEQALAGMKTGGVRLVIVPPAVGYGTSTQGNIPANSVLVFQVQLLAVQ